MAEMYELFKALGDPSRERMVERLSFGSATVSELSDGLGLTPPAITKHLDILERAGMIKRERRGRTVVCSLLPTPLTELADWLTDRWALWAR